MSKDSLELTNLVEKSYNIGINKMNQMMGEFYLYLTRKSPALAKKFQTVLQNGNSNESWSRIHQEFLSLPSTPTSCTRKFYEVLKNHNYFIESEIAECIENLVDDGVMNESFWLQCPWIKEIKSDEQKEVFHLTSLKKDFTFSSVRALYNEECEEIKQKLNGESYAYLCHTVSYMFSQMHKETYAVTCVCPHHFSNVYWFHSYNLSADQNFVIDIANGIYMPVEDFYRLIKPEFILDQSKGEEIQKRLEEIKRSQWEYANVTKNVPLKALAFYAFDSLKDEEREEKLRKLTRF